MQVYMYITSKGENIMSSVPDNYEINITKNGKHWGRILIPEWRTEDAEIKLKFLRELFGDEYHITMIHWICRGQVDDSWT